MGTGASKSRDRPELLQCSICFNVFKIPRMLPCQHTFCENCLHTYITKTMAFDTEKASFPCPMCREVVSVPSPEKPRGRWARLFPKNRLIISLFEGEIERSECCRLHPGKMVEFYCESHIEIGCSTCLITRHKGCEVVQIETFIKSGKFKRSCQKNNDMLQQYKKMFENMIVESGQNLDSLDKQKASLVEDIKDMKNTIETLLKNLEEKILIEIEEKYKTECDSLCERTSRCRKIVADINNSIEQVSAAQSDINMIQKAEIIVSVEEKIANYGKSIRNEHEEFNVINIGLTFDPLVEDMKQGIEKLGDVSIERSHKDLLLPPFVPKSQDKESESGKRHRSKHVVKISEHCASGEEESFFCNITDTHVMPDGRVILADDSNSKLKMLNGRFEVDFELIMDSNPLNLAHVSDDEIAVTLPGKREVCFVEVGLKSFTVKRKIKTRLDCWGIDILENLIIVTTGRDGHSIIILDMKGKELNSFLLTTHADENIRCPVSVIADKRRRLMYVTCTGGAWSKGCVVCMDINGKLENVYSDPDIDTPRSAALDRHGKLYICGLESSTVYQFNEKGEVFRIFPSKTEQIVGPLHLNFIKNYHIRFLLTEVASDILKIYELPTAK